MIKKFSLLQPLVSLKLASMVNIACLVAIWLSVGINPSLAADPFRSQRTRQIGNTTEEAFKAIFKQGNYPAAQRYLKQAISEDADEPLAYAMQAALAYTSKDWATLGTYSRKTLETAQKLIAQDPLRGNLYTAVGHFLEGALILVRQGTVKGAPQALGRLRQVYDSLDKAEAVAKDDPELNLVKGYMDLMLAVNLPFANPEQAIQRLEKNAAPQYLVDRGIALAYRDMKKYDRALEYANRALKKTADNPELYYLKAQILREKANKNKNKKLMQEAIANFDKTLAKKSQLPPGVVKQVQRERRRAGENLSQ
ncbi:MAG: Sll0314/Alr1548 family TPR repeat-containing protein [Calothrix sp. MO_192.B10]|nr:Sll0314/Alr1548 family TPR repeat-containing protein [Calothrix sp. MO_192.B10]